MDLKAQKIQGQIIKRIKDSTEFSKYFTVLGTLTEIMTKKLVNCSKKLPGHFQDKTLKMVNSRTFPGFPGFPGHADTLKKQLKFSTKTFNAISKFT